MTAVSETDLATKCLEFCQALNSQGNAFKFSLTLASGFAFSFDSKELALDNQAKKKKKPSPSTIRRNARRKEEFLKKKLNFVSPSSALDTPADETPVSTPVAPFNAKIKLNGCLFNPTHFTLSTTLCTNWLGTS